MRGDRPGCLEGRIRSNSRGSGLLRRPGYSLERTRRSSTSLKSQMNGAHAELFSFCLIQKVLRALSNQGQLAPLILRAYQSVNGTDFEPYISLAFAQEEYWSSIKVGFKKGSFFISIDSTSLQDRPIFRPFSLIRWVSREMTTVAFQSQSAGQLLRAPYWGSPKPWRMHPKPIRILLEQYERHNCRR